MNMISNTTAFTVVTSLVLYLAQAKYLLVNLEQDDGESLISRQGEISPAQDKWTSCPRETSKRYTCLPLSEQVLREKSTDESTGGDAKSQYLGHYADNFYKAVQGCKRDCGMGCNSFNIQKREFGLGYTCTFYNSIVDGKNCFGCPGCGDQTTTYMKYTPGDCAKANPNKTLTCCNEEPI